MRKVSGTVVLWFLPWTALGAEEGFQSEPLRHAGDLPVAHIGLAILTPFVPILPVCLPVENFAQEPAGVVGFDGGDLLGRATGDDFSAGIAALGT